MPNLKPSNHRVIVRLSDGALVSPDITFWRILAYGLDFTDFLALLIGITLLYFPNFYQFSHLLKIIVGQPQLMLTVWAMLNDSKVFVIEECLYLHLRHVFE